MRARDNKCQISQNAILHINFYRILPVFTILVEFCYYIYSPYKMTKNKLFTQLVQGFCRLKIKITQFPGEVNVAKLSNRLRLGDYSKLVYTHSVIVVIQSV